eukprot:scaffold22545_cov126-Isochrysis_galbana.AAC.7
MTGRSPRETPQRAAGKRPAPTPRASAVVAHRWHFNWCHPLAAVDLAGGGIGRRGCTRTSFYGASGLAHLRHHIYLLHRNRRTPSTP